MEDLSKRIMEMCKENGQLRARNVQLQHEVQRLSEVLGIPDESDECSISLWVRCLSLASFVVVVLPVLILCVMLSPFIVLWLLWEKLTKESPK